MLEGNNLPSIVTLKVSFIKLVRRGGAGEGGGGGGGGRGGPANSVLTGLYEGRGGLAVSARTP